MSKFSSTMVKVYKWNEILKLGYSKAFQEVKFQHIPSHGECGIMIQYSKIRRFWDVLESLVLKYSSTMVKVWLWINTVVLGNSEVSRTIRFINFLQPRWRYDYEIK